MSEIDDVIFENEIGFVLPVKNESEYIEEWLQYYYAMGVGKFYIYNNQSEDRQQLLKVLKPWIDKKVVEFEDFPGRAAQLAIYSDAVYKHRFDCRYLGFLDADEFIYIKSDQNLLEFVNTLMSAGDTASGLVMFWRCFGTGGQDKKLPGGVIDRFVMRSDLEFKANTFTKTILNPRRVRSVGNPHFAKFYPGTICLDEFSNPVENICADHGKIMNVQINHYMTKSTEEYIKKRSRGRADSIDKHLEGEFELYSQGNIEDRGLFNKWHAMQQDPHMRRIESADPSLHDERLILNNILQMMNPILNDNFATEFYFGQIEKYTTCFGLIRKLKNISENERDFLEDRSLHAIELAIQSNKIRAYNIFLLFNMLPELMSTKSKHGWAIIRLCQELIPKLVPMCQSYQNIEDYSDLMFVKKLLESIE